jgi:hypothetical protein
MKFQLLLNIISFMIGIKARTNKSIREMVRIRNCAYVVKTRDGKVGRRFIFKEGRYSSDRVLDDGDLALVFDNADIGFKALALDGPTGMTKAQNNFELTLVGNQNIFSFLGVIIGVSMGMLKRP